MWMTILMSVITSETVKQLIALGIKKLLDSKEDGVTKEVAEVMLDGIAQSRSNNVDMDAIDIIKKAL